ncbi:FecCD family ABC transporter permease [Streptomyces sp. NPDC001780]
MNRQGGHVMDHNTAGGTDPGGSAPPACAAPRRAGGADDGTSPGPPDARSRGGRWVAALVVTLALVALFVLVSLGVGARGVPLGTVWRVLLHDDGSPDAVIVHHLRLPRTALAVVVGAALATAGVVMQAITRNPLAEPGIVGVNSGASFAVVIAIAAFHVTSVAGYVWFAFCGAVLAALLVYALTSSGAARGRHHTRLVLAGAALSASLGAGTGILTMFDSDAFDSYRFWVVGSLENRGTEALPAILPFAVAGLLLALVLGPSLNALALGDDVGASLGLRVGWVRAAGFASVMLLCGAATAAAGPIGFVGLVVPHVLRLLLGPDLRRLLALSVPGGALLLLVSDVVGRVVAPPGEVEAGVVTAFIGAPVLLWLVVRRGEIAR